MRFLQSALILILAALLVLPACAQDGVRQSLSAANRLRAQGRYDQAAAAYQQALKLATQPQDKVQAYFGLAAIYQLQHESAKTLAVYLAVVRLEGISPAYKIVAWRQIASLALQQGDRKSARTADEHLLNDFAKVPEARQGALLDLALLDQQEGKYGEAVKRLQTLLQEAPRGSRAPQAWTLLVQAQVQAGDPAGAAASARQGQKQFPASPQITLSLVEALQQAGKIKEAAQYAQDLLVTQSLDEGIFHTLYSLDKQAGQLPQLIAWLEARAKQEPLDIVWLGHLAELYEWEKQDDKAYEVQKRIVQRRPTDANVLREAAQAALKVRALDQAGDWLQDAVAVAPQDQSLAMLLGEVRLQQGRPDQAMTVWKHGLHYKPNDPRSVAALGGTLSRYGLQKQAIAIYQEGRRALGDPNAFAANLGQAYEGVPDLPAAIGEYIKALADPRHSGGASLAQMRLQSLAEDETARPQVIAVLQKDQAAGKLPPQAQGALLYARVLAGDNVKQALAGFVTQVSSNTAVRLLSRLAGDLESRGHLAAAAEVYSRLLQEPAIGPYAAPIALHAADLQVNLGDWRRALKLLNAAPTTGLAGSLADRLTLARADLLLHHAHQPAEAAPLYSSVLAEGQRGWASLKAQWGEADVAFALGKYEEARKDYGQLLKSGDEASAETSDQSVLEALPLLPGVPLSVTEAPKLPSAGYVTYQEAEMLFRQGQTAAASKAFSTFAARHPDSPYANDALERVLLLQKFSGNPPGAAEFRQALQAFDAGQPDQAARLLAEITSSPLADAAALQLGDIEQWQGHTKAAVQAYTALAAKYPDSPLAPRALFQAAGVQLKEAPEAARQCLEELVKKYPQAPVTAEGQALLDALGQQAAAR